ncbi:hypothetical protein BB559_002342 [Furculomyces boomerangus]|uniref:Ras-GAP domain-containing protein n=1 Tax=Furculomyces boomerangus TaxID=61424 RepID=A0A2T9YW56_9FUNG|nr:hypothetical protein BB559_002342 [Furculomyces boomerangus]
MIQYSTKYLKNEVDLLFEKLIIAIKSDSKELENNLSLLECITHLLELYPNNIKTVTHYLFLAIKHTQNSNLTNILKHKCYLVLWRIMATGLYFNWINSTESSNDGILESMNSISAPSLNDDLALSILNILKSQYATFSQDSADVPKHKPIWYFGRYMERWEFDLMPFLYAPKFPSIRSADKTTRFLSYHCLSFDSADISYEISVVLDFIFSLLAKSNWVVIMSKIRKWLKSEVYSLPEDQVSTNFRLFIFCNYSYHKLDEVIKEISYYFENSNKAPKKYIFARIHFIITGFIRQNTSVFTDMHTREVEGMQSALDLYNSLEDAWTKKQSGKISESNDSFDINNQSAYQIELENKKWKNPKIRPLAKNSPSKSLSIEKPRNQFINLDRDSIAYLMTNLLILLPKKAAEVDNIVKLAKKKTGLFILVKNVQTNFLQYMISEFNKASTSDIIFNAIQTLKYAAVLLPTQCNKGIVKLEKYFKLNVNASYAKKLMVPDINGEYSTFLSKGFFCQLSENPAASINRFNNLYSKKKVPLSSSLAFIRGLCSYLALLKIKNEDIPETINEPLKSLLVDIFWNSLSKLKTSFNVKQSNNNWKNISKDIISQYMVIKNNNTPSNDLNNTSTNEKSIQTQNPELRNNTQYSKDQIAISKAIEEEIQHIAIIKATLRAYQILPNLGIKKFSAGNSTIHVVVAISTIFELDIMEIYPAAGLALGIIIQQIGNPETLQNPSSVQTEFQDIIIQALLNISIVLKNTPVYIDSKKCLEITKILCYLLEKRHSFVSKNKTIRNSFIKRKADTLLENAIESLAFKQLWIPNNALFMVTLECINLMYETNKLFIGKIGLMNTEDDIPSEGCNLIKNLSMVFQSLNHKNSHHARLAIKTAFLHSYESKKTLRDIWISSFEIWNGFTAAITTLNIQFKNYKRLNNQNAYPKGSYSSIIDESLDFIDSFDENDDFKIFMNQTFKDNGNIQLVDTHRKETLYQNQMDNVSDNKYQSYIAFFDKEIRSKNGDLYNISYSKSCVDVFKSALSVISPQKSDESSSNEKNTNHGYMKLVRNNFDLKRSNSFKIDFMDKNFFSFWNDPSSVPIKSGFEKISDLGKIASKFFEISNGYPIALTVSKKTFTISEVSFQDQYLSRFEESYNKLIDMWKNLTAYLLQTGNVCIEPLPHFLIHKHPENEMDTNYNNSNAFDFCVNSNHLDDSYYKNMKPIPQFRCLVESFCKLLSGNNHYFKNELQILISLDSHKLLQGFILKDIFQYSERYQKLSSKGLEDVQNFKDLLLGLIPIMNRFLKSNNLLIKEDVLFLFRFIVDSIKEHFFYIESLCERDMRNITQMFLLIPHSNLWDSLYYHLIIRNKMFHILSSWSLGLIICNHHQNIKSLDNSTKWLLIARMAKTKDIISKDLKLSVFWVDGDLDGMTLESDKDLFNLIENYMRLHKFSLVFIEKLPKNEIVVDYEIENLGFSFNDVINYTTNTVNNILETNFWVGVGFMTDNLYHECAYVQNMCFVSLATYFEKTNKIEKIEFSNKRSILNQIIDVLVSDDRILLKAIYDSRKKSTIESMTSCLVDIFSSCKKQMDLIRFLVEQEIQSHESPSGVFRMDSVAVNVLKLNILFHGYDFFYMIVQDPIVKEIELGLSDSLYEIDPLLLNEKDDIDVNMKNVERVCLNILDSIYENTCYIPKRVKVALSIVKDIVESKFPGYGLQAVGGIIFLRVISPVLVVPENIGLDINKGLKKALKLCAKAIQRQINDINIFQPDSDSLKSLNNSYYSEDTQNSTKALYKLIGLYSEKIGHILNAFSDTSGCEDFMSSNIDQDNSQESCIEDTKISYDRSNIIEDDTKYDKLMVNDSSYALLQHVVFSNIDTVFDNISSSTRNVIYVDKESEELADRAFQTKKHFWLLVLMATRPSSYKSVIDSHLGDFYRFDAILTKSTQQILDENKNVLKGDTKYKDLFYITNSPQGVKILCIILRRINSGSMNHHKIFLQFLQTLLELKDICFDIFFDASSFRGYNEISINLIVRIVSIMAFTEGLNTVRNIHWLNMNERLLSHIFKRINRVVDIAQWRYRSDSLKMSKKEVFVKSLDFFITKSKFPFNISQFPSIFENYKDALPKGTILIEEEGDSEFFDDFSFLAIYMVESENSSMIRSYPCAIKVTENSLQIADLVSRTFLNNIPVYCNNVIHIGEIESVYILPLSEETSDVEFDFSSWKAGIDFSIDDYDFTDNNDVIDSDYLGTSMPKKWAFKEYEKVRNLSKRKATELMTIRVEGSNTKISFYPFVNPHSAFSMIRSARTIYNSKNQKKIKKFQTSARSPLDTVPTLISSIMFGFNSPYSTVKENAYNMLITMAQTTGVNIQPIFSEKGTNSSPVKTKPIPIKISYWLKEHINYNGFNTWLNLVCIEANDKVPGVLLDFYQFYSLKDELFSNLKAYEIKPFISEISFILAEYSPEVGPLTLNYLRTHIASIPSTIESPRKAIETYLMIENMLNIIASSLLEYKLFTIEHFPELAVVLTLAFSYENSSTQILVYNCIMNICQKLRITFEDEISGLIYQEYSTNSENIYISSIVRLNHLRIDMVKTFAPYLAGKTENEFDSSSSNSSFEFFGNRDSNTSSSESQYFMNDFESCDTDIMDTGVIKYASNMTRLVLKMSRFFLEITKLPAFNCSAKDTMKYGNLEKYINNESRFSSNRNSSQSENYHSQTNSMSLNDSRNASTNSFPKTENFRYPKSLNIIISTIRADKKHVEEYEISRTIKEFFFYGEKWRSRITTLITIDTTVESIFFKPTICFMFSEIMANKRSVFDLASKKSISKELYTNNSYMDINKGRELVQTNIIGNILNLLRRALESIDEKHVAYVVSLVVCVSQSINKILDDNFLLHRIFWISVSLLQIKDMEIYKASLLLLKNTFETIANNFEKENELESFNYSFGDNGSMERDMNNARNINDFIKQQDIVRNDCLSIKNELSSVEFFFQIDFSLGFYTLLLPGLSFMEENNHKLDSLLNFNPRPLLELYAKLCFEKQFIEITKLKKLARMEKNEHCLSPSCKNSRFLDRRRFPTAELCLSCHLKTVKNPKSTPFKIIKDISIPDCDREPKNSIIALIYLRLISDSEMFITEKFDGSDSVTTNLVDDLILNSLRLHLNSYAETVYYDQQKVLTLVLNDLREGLSQEQHDFLEDVRSKRIDHSENILQAEKSPNLLRVVLVSLWVLCFKTKSIPIFIRTIDFVTNLMSEFFNIVYKYIKLELSKIEDIEMNSKYNHHINLFKNYFEVEIFVCGELVSVCMKLANSEGSVPKELSDSINKLIILLQENYEDPSAILTTFNNTQKLMKYFGVNSSHDFYKNNSGFGSLGLIQTNNSMNFRDPTLTSINLSIPESNSSRKVVSLNQYQSIITSPDKKSLVSKFLPNIPLRSASRENIDVSSSKSLIGKHNDFNIGHDNDNLNNSSDLNSFGLQEEKFKVQNETPRYSKNSSVVLKSKKRETQEKGINGKENITKYVHRDSISVENFTSKMQISKSVPSDAHKTKNKNKNGSVKRENNNQRIPSSRTPAISMEKYQKHLGIDYDFKPSFSDDSDFGRSAYFSSIKSADLGMSKSTSLSFTSRSNKPLPPNPPISDDKVSVGVKENVQNLKRLKSGAFGSSKLKNKTVSNVPSNLSMSWVFESGGKDNGIKKGSSGIGMTIFNNVKTKIESRVGKSKNLFRKNKYKVDEYQRPQYPLVDNETQFEQEMQNLGLYSQSESSTESLIPSHKKNYGLQFSEIFHIVGIPGLYELVINDDDINSPDSKSAAIYTCKLIKDIFYNPV